MLEIDTIITLINNDNYGLLLKSSIDGEDYFLAVKLDDKEEPTDDYKVFKELKKDGKSFVVEENDVLILNKLLEDFSDMLDDEVDE